MAGALHVLDNEARADDFAGLSQRERECAVFRAPDEQAGHGDGVAQHEAMPQRGAVEVDGRGGHTCGRQKVREGVFVRAACGAHLAA